MATDRFTKIEDLGPIARAEVESMPEHLRLAAMDNEFSAAHAFWLAKFRLDEAVVAFPGSFFLTQARARLAEAYMWCEKFDPKTHVEAEMAAEMAAAARPGIITATAEQTAAITQEKVERPAPRKKK